MPRIEKFSIHMLKMFLYDVDVHRNRILVSLLVLADFTSVSFQLQFLKTELLQKILGGVI